VEHVQIMQLDTFCYHTNYFVCGVCGKDQQGKNEGNNYPFYKYLHYYANISESYSSFNIEITCLDSH